MVTSKPWYDYAFKADDDFSEKYRTDESFREFMTHLASLGVCTLIPLTSSLAGFGLPGVTAGLLSFVPPTLLYSVILTSCRILRSSLAVNHRQRASRQSLLFPAERGSGR
jgi:hypothetical protein